MPFNIPEIPALLEKNAIVIFFITALTLGAATIKLLRNLWEFYEDHIRSRRFKEILRLCAEAQADTISLQYLTKMKENEIFRLASGIESSLEESEMLMRLFMLGFITPSELKIIQPYVKPDSEKILVRVTFSSKVRFLSSFVLMCYFFTSGIILGFLFFFGLPGIGLLIGLLIFALSIFGGIIVGMGYRPYPLLKEVKTKLEKMGMLSDSSHIA